MIDENIKVNPKIWSREYTFGEYKLLNPHVNEISLISYYNRSLREYLNDLSKHMDLFNKTKETLSEEIRLLRNKNWDNDQTVGPTGVGRKFRSPLPPLSNSLEFDQIDDSVALNFIQEGRIPNDGTLKPYKGLTFAVWVNFNDILDTSAHISLPFSTGTSYTILSSQDSQSGWALYFNNTSLTFSMFHTLTPNSGLWVRVLSNYKAFHDYITDQPGSSGALAGNKQQFRDDGWHYIVGTWDGRDQTLWVDGIPSYASGLTNNPTNNNTEHTWNISTGGGLGNITGLGHADSGSVGGLSGTDILAGASATVSGSLGSMYYSNTGTGYLANNHLNNVTIGANPDTNTDGSFKTNSAFWTGSIAEVAIWDEALDATTINELWHNGVSGSAAKFDLSYPGYDNGAHNHNHIYDTYDEGLNYTNVGRYANSLQGWWRLDGEGLATTSIVGDLSGKGRDGELWNKKTLTSPSTGSYPGPTFGGGFDITL